MHQNRQNCRHKHNPNARSVHCKPVHMNSQGDPPASFSAATVSAKQVFSGATDDSGLSSSCYRSNCGILGQYNESPSAWDLALLEVSKRYSPFLFTLSQAELKMAENMHSTSQTSDVNGSCGRNKMANGRLHEYDPRFSNI